MLKLIEIAHFLLKSGILKGNSSFLFLNEIILQDAKVDD